MYTLVITIIICLASQPCERRIVTVPYNTSAQCMDAAQQMLGPNTTVACVLTQVAKK